MRLIKALLRNCMNTEQQSISQLVEHFNADSLSGLKRPWGKSSKKSAKDRYDFAAGARDVVGTGGCSSSANHPAS